MMAQPALLRHAHWPIRFCSDPWIAVHETDGIPHASFHLVERRHLRHPVLDLALRRELVGEDEYGNRYYRTTGGRIDPTLHFERRWVIYKGLAEASTIGPAWHGWMHHTVDAPPTAEPVKPRPWWKPHRPNLTGTPAAYRPTGSTLAQNRRPNTTGDYRPWTPGR
jgi:NADH:ubiquinone oxidoreductase subunit